MITPEAPLDIMGLAQQVSCFGSDITFMKSHYIEQDIYTVCVVRWVVHQDSRANIRAHRRTGSSSCLYEPEKLSLTN